MMRSETLKHYREKYLLKELSPANVLKAFAAGIKATITLERLKKLQEKRKDFKKNALVDPWQKFKEETGQLKMMLSQEKDKKEEAFVLLKELINGAGTQEFTPEKFFDIRRRANRLFKK